MIWWTNEWKPLCSKLLTEVHKRKWSYNGIIFSFNFSKKTRIICILVVNSFCRNIAVVEKLKLALKTHLTLTATASLLSSLVVSSNVFTPQQNFRSLNDVQVPPACGKSQSSSLWKTRCYGVVALLWKREGTQRVQIQGLQRAVRKEERSPSGVWGGRVGNPNCFRIAHRSTSYHMCYLLAQPGPGPPSGDTCRNKTDTGLPLLGSRPVGQRRDHAHSSNDFPWLQGPGRPAADVRPAEGWLRKAGSCPASFFYI